MLGLKMTRNPCRPRSLHSKTRNKAPPPYFSEEEVERTGDILGNSIIICSPFPVGPNYISFMKSSGGTKEISGSASPLLPQDCVLTTPSYSGVTSPSPYHTVSFLQAATGPFHLCVLSTARWPNRYSKNIC